MPLTQAERNKKCREKKKESGKYQDLLKEDRERKAAKKKHQLQIDLDIVRFKNRESQRKSRAKKKETLLQSKTAAATPSTSALTPDSKSRSPVKSPFSNSQSLGKAKRKVEKALPMSPRKKVAIIALFSEKYSEMLKTYVKPLKQSGEKLLPEVKEAVLNFFEDNEVSWQTPGMKDFVIVYDEKRIKSRKQKRYMLMTMQEAYEQFRQKNPR